MEKKSSQDIENRPFVRVAYEKLQRFFDIFRGMFNCMISDRHLDRGDCAVNILSATII